MIFLPTFYKTFKIILPSNFPCVRGTLYIIKFLKLIYLIFSPGVIFALLNVLTTFPLFLYFFAVTWNI